MKLKLWRRIAFSIVASLWLASALWPPWIHRASGPMFQSSFLPPINYIPEPAPSDYAFLFSRSVGPTKIDVTRLLVEWSALSALVGLLRVWKPGQPKP